MMMIQMILATIINLLLLTLIALSCYNKGYDDGYISGLISQKLGFDDMSKHLNKDSK